MLRRIVCRGAPRDLGLDQGRACRDPVREQARRAGLAPRGGLAELLAGALRREPRDARLARDLARHHPHLAERTAGIARGAKVPLRLPIALLAREGPGGALALRSDATGASLELELAADTASWEGVLCVRESRPEGGGYASLAVTRPWLAGALAGVNERGLAAAVRLAASSHHERASAVCLVEQCLERLDTAAKALEWCESRPAGGDALLAFADAGGGSGALALGAGGRRRLAAPTLPRADAQAGVVIRSQPAGQRLEVTGPDGARGEFAL